MALFNSPFSPDAASIDPSKFGDPGLTLAGLKRASIRLERLETLWFNTGSVCELTCASCHLESSPRNDTLTFLSLDEVLGFLDEIAEHQLPTTQVGLTGGEPFVNHDIIAILEAVLARNFHVVVLTSGLRAMRLHDDSLQRLSDAFAGQLLIRVGIDHHRREVHEAERGIGTWHAALAGLAWLGTAGVPAAVTARCLPGESEDAFRAGFAALFAEHGIGLDASSPSMLLRLPEMDSGADTVEIAEADWEAVRPMCATSRMVVRRRGETARVVACPLLPYEAPFDLGATLATARRRVTLNHPHCARFCVLGCGCLHA